MSFTMSAVTASTFVQVIAVFFLAMIVEGRSSMPKKNSDKRRKHIKEIGFASLGTISIVLYLIWVIENDGVVGGVAFLAWAAGILYLLLTALMTFVNVFSSAKP